MLEKPTRTQQSRTLKAIWLTSAPTPLRLLLLLLLLTRAAVWLDLNSHWNGLIEPSDAIMLGGDNVTVEVAFIALPAAADSRQSLLCVGQQYWERLDLRLLYDSDGQPSLQMEWTHANNAQVTRLPTALSLNSNVSHVVRLELLGVQYRHSNESVTRYRLFLDGEAASAVDGQRPPLPVIPLFASVGLSSVDSNDPQRFTGLLSSIQIMPTSGLDAVGAGEITVKE